MKRHSEGPRRKRSNQGKPFKKKGKGTGEKRTTQPSKESENGTRLNKYLANAGVCSRREADKLIANGEVKVNGEVVAEMGFKVQPGDEVRHLGKLLKKERFKYLLLNKPKDCISTVSDEQGRRTVMDLIDGACPERVYPVGRLDRNTTGLLLFTNDGDLTKKLTHPSYNVRKTYNVEFEKGVSEEHLNQLVKGVELEDGFSKFDKAEFGENGHNHKIVVVDIHSGKNRIVRRMFEHLGYEVKKLDRVYFAGLTKGKLNRGKWRFLDKKEVGFLKTAAKKD